MLRVSLAELELRGMGRGLPLGGICPDFCRMVGKAAPWTLPRLTAPVSQMSWRGAQVLIPGGPWHTL